MDIRKLILPIMGAGVLSLALAAGAFTYHSVSAQASTPTPSAPSDEAAPAAPEAGKRGRMPRGERGDLGAAQQDLADALGIDLETLQAAQQAAGEKALAQAVEQGLITQEQADRMKERGLNAPGLGMLRIKGGIEGIDHDALLAEELGISVEELEAAQQKAMEAALARAVENGAITQEQVDLMNARKSLADEENFQSSMQSAFESAVAQAVKDGVITQAQADLILQNSSGKWLGGRIGPGGMPGRGGPDHGWGGAAPDAPAEPGTSTTPEGGL